jgi:hypothetical protein
MQPLEFDECRNNRAYNLRIQDELSFKLAFMQASVGFSPESSIHSDNCLVGHHVLGDGRRSSDLSRGAMEGLVEIGIPLFFRATSL